MFLVSSCTPRNVRHACACLLWCRFQDQWDVQLLPQVLETFRSLSVASLLSLRMRKSPRILLCWTHHAWPWQRRKHLIYIGYSILRLWYGYGSRLDRDWHDPWCWNEVEAVRPRHISTPWVMSIPVYTTPIPISQRAGCYNQYISQQLHLFATLSCFSIDYWRSPQFDHSVLLL